MNHEYHSYSIYSNHSGLHGVWEFAELRFELAQLSESKWELVHDLL